METSRAERRIVTVQRLVAAPPEGVFAVLTDVRRRVARLDALLAG